MTTAIRSKVMTISPKQAAEWLKKNSGNRPLSIKRVQKYALEMKKGHWKTNGEPIIISENGNRLMDGQHRLAAVVESGISIESLVVFGTKEDTFDTLGSGDPRSMGDVLRIKNEMHYTHLAAALSRLWYYEQSGGMSMHNAGADIAPSKIDLEELLEKHPKLRNSVAFCVERRTNLIPGTILAAAHYIFSKKGIEKANDFIDKVVSGADMPKGHPIMLLRKRLIERRESSEKLSLNVVVYFLFRVWRAVQKNETLTKLQLPKDDFSLDPV